MGGSKGGGTTTQSSTTSIPPEVLARYNSVNAQAQAAAAQPFTPYTGEFVAPVNQTQQGGINNITNSNGTYQPYFDAATSNLNGGLAGSQPYYSTATGQVASGLAAGTAGNANATSSLTGGLGGADIYNTMAGGNYQTAYNGAQPYNGAATGLALAGTQAVNPGALNIGQYMSPYTQSVINSTLGYTDQKQAQDRNALTSNAILSGSYGGDRSGIARGVLQGQQDLARSNIVSGLYNQNYQQALAAGQQQQGVGLGAAQSNRAALQGGANQLLGIGNQGYTQGMGYGSANQGLGQQLYSQGLGASQQYGNIGQQGFSQGLGAANANLGIGGQLFNQGNTAAGTNAGLGTGLLGAQLQQGQAQLGAGTVQQQTGQAQDTAVYNQFLQQQGYPFQVAQFLANIAEGTGALSGSTTTGNTTAPQPFFSDERLKENIKTIGHTKDGLKIIRFNYKGSPHTQIGLSAQDVEKTKPEAVGLAGGFKTVDYDRATRALGGAVANDNAGQGFAGGGMAYDPSTLSAILMAHQAMYPGANGASRVAGGTPGAQGIVPPASGSAPKSLKSAELMKLPAAQPTGLKQTMNDVNGVADLYKTGKTVAGGAKDAIVGSAASADGKTPASGGLLGTGGKWDPAQGWVGKQMEPSAAPSTGGVTSTPLPPIDATAGAAGDVAAAVPADMSLVDDAIGIVARRGGRIQRAAGGGAPFADYSILPEDSYDPIDPNKLKSEQAGLENKLPGGGSGGHGGGGSGLGGTLGSLGGAALGSFGGPLGMMAGSALGGMFGKMFKNGGRTGYEVGGGVVDEAPVMDPDALEARRLKAGLAPVPDNVVPFKREPVPFSPFHARAESNAPPVADPDVLEARHPSVGLAPAREAPIADPDVLARHPAGGSAPFTGPEPNGGTWADDRWAGAKIVPSRTGELAPTVAGNNSPESLRRYAELRAGQPYYNGVTGTINRRTMTPSVGENGENYNSNTGLAGRPAFDVAAEDAQTSKMFTPPTGLAPGAPAPALPTPTTVSRAPVDRTAPVDFNALPAYINGAETDGTNFNNPKFPVAAGGPDGPGQFTRDTWRTFAAANPQYFQGKTPEQIDEMRKDPALSNAGTIWYAKQNAPLLEQAGIPVTKENLYLAHGQGAAGAIGLLRDPQRNSLEALTAVYGGDRQRALKVIADNGGTPDMTAGQFAATFSDRANRAMLAQKPGGGSADDRGLIVPPTATARTSEPTASGLGGAGLGAADITLPPKDLKKGDWLDRYERPIVAGLTFLGNMLGSKSHQLVGSIGEGIAAAAPAYAAMGFKQQEAGLTQQGQTIQSRSLDIQQRAQYMTLLTQLRTMQNARTSRGLPEDPQLAAQIAHLAQLVASGLPPGPLAGQPSGAPAAPAGPSAAPPVQPATGPGAGVQPPANPPQGPLGANTPSPAPAITPAMVEAHPAMRDMPAAAASPDFLKTLHPDENFVELYRRADQIVDDGDPNGAHAQAVARADRAVANMKERGWALDPAGNAVRMPGWSNIQRENQFVPDNQKWSQAEGAANDERQKTRVSLNLVKEALEQFKTNPNAHITSEIQQQLRFAFPNLDLGDSPQWNAGAVAEIAKQAAARAGVAGTTDFSHSLAQVASVEATKPPEANKKILAQAIGDIDRADARFDYLNPNLSRVPYADRTELDRIWTRGKGHDAQSFQDKAYKELAVRGATPSWEEMKPDHVYMLEPGDEKKYHMPPGTLTGPTKYRRTENGWARVK